MAAIIAALSGCATTNSGVNAYSITDWHSLVASEKITWHDRPDTAYVDLQANALWAAIYQPHNIDMAYKNLGAMFQVRDLMRNAAVEYRKKLGANYVYVEFLDSAGYYIASGDDVTPNGYHWAHTGIVYRNGPFGPTDIYPRFGLKRDQ